MTPTRPLPYARLPLTYTESLVRFRRSARGAGLLCTSHRIGATGPDRAPLTIDAVELGAPDASRLLVVLSGVHGVEGFIGSALQCDLLDRVEPAALADGTALLLVHAVNPWGMAWWRRQNESNVDLNRNWRRDELDPVHNDAYDEIHDLACPTSPTMPDVDGLLATAATMVAERGLPWVRDAITTGQYRHADGLHYGGAHTEQSNRIVEEITRTRILGRERVLVIDLHTGHGPNGEITLLSDAAPGTDQDAFFHACFPEVRVEATVDNPDATTARKSGQIANGIRDLMPVGACWSTAAELGTASDLEQLAATYRSHWVHFHGDPENPDHAEAIWAYRCCFTPDDAAWEQVAFERGRRLLDAAITALSHWDAAPTNGA